MNKSNKLKFGLIGASAINLIALSWFLLGSTANFNRGIDLITTILFFVIAVPSALMLIISVLMIFLLRNRDFTEWKMYLACILIAGMLLISISLVLNVNTSGWLTENVQTDLLQVTEDRQFEYCIELVNLFQKNSSARLYMKNLQDSSEMYIPLDLPTRNIGGLMTNQYFSNLELTDSDNIFKLVTTYESPFPEIEFEINIQEKTAIRIN